MDKNEIINLSITSLSSDGSGVGRHAGMAVFVPHTAPGDEVRVKIVKVRKNCAFGRVEKILTPSPDRIAPDCPVFGKCGGCAYRHLSYGAELRAKEQMVADAMRRIGKINLPPEPILGTKLPDGYRNKAQYPVSRVDEKLLIGFYAPRSHRVIDCRTCRLQPREFETALAVFDSYIRTYNVSCYDEQTGRGLLRHIYLRRAEATGEVMACAVINGQSLPHSTALVELLRRAVPGLKSVCLNINRERTNVILGNECKTLWGDGYITDVLCGNRTRISPLSFYQVNRAQAERLYGKVRDYLAPHGTETVLDLYCGAGTISLSLAKHVRQVIGAEIVAQAVEDAQVNAQINGITNARFFCADAGEAASRLEREGIRPDAIIVDPPRKGCSEELLRVITSMSPDKIIYVSCDPATLARDCARLTADGWRVNAYTPVDLFPRTAHCETVAELFNIKKQFSKSTNGTCDCAPAVVQSRRTEGNFMYRYLFFDLDGTLTDPKEGITNSVAYALKSYGIHAEPEELIPFIGPPLHESFMQFYGFDREKAMEAVGKYREYFADRGIWENALLPGVPELLAELKARGRAIALATSKPEVFARQILEHFKIADCFDAVCGSCLDGSRTKKAEVIETAHARLERALGTPVPLESCVMIGDRLHDIEGARGAGMDSIGLTFGYGGVQELKQAGATYLADSFAQLLKIIG